MYHSLFFEWETNLSPFLLKPISDEKDKTNDKIIKAIVVEQKTRRPLFSFIVRIP
jgi:hypothetical protein